MILLRLTSLVLTVALAGCGKSGDGSELGSTASDEASGDAAALDSEPEPVSTPEDDDVVAEATAPDPTVEVPVPSTTVVTPALPDASAPPAPEPVSNPTPVVPTAPIPAVVVDSGLVPEPEPAAPEPSVDPDWPFDAMNDPIENPAECPAEAPGEFDTCNDANLVCKYGSEIDCRSRYLCSENGMWYLEYGPRDCPEVCPEAEPVEGDPCDVEKAVCDFGDTPSCTAQWMCWDGTWALLYAAECDATAFCPSEQPVAGDPCTVEEARATTGRCIYPGGASCGCGCTWFGEETAPTIEWYCSITSAQYPPEYITACPSEVPEEGTPCDTGSTCGYPLNDMCSEPYAGSTLANCVDFAWVLSIELPQPGL